MVLVHHQNPWTAQGSRLLEMAARAKCGDSLEGVDNPLCDGEDHVFLDGAADHEPRG